MIQSLTLLARQWVKIIKLLFPVGLLVLLVLLIWMIIGIRIINIISMTVHSWISRKLVLGIYIMLSQTATTSQSNTIATASSSSDDVKEGRYSNNNRASICLLLANLRGYHLGAQGIVQHYRCVHRKIYNSVVNGTTRSIMWKLLSWESFIIH